MRRPDDSQNIQCSFSITASLSFLIKFVSFQSMSDSGRIQIWMLFSCLNQTRVIFLVCSILVQPNDYPIPFSLTAQMNGMRKNGWVSVGKKIVSLAKCHALPAFIKAPRLKILAVPPLLLVVYMIPPEMSNRPFEG